MANYSYKIAMEEAVRKRTCEKLGISVGNLYELLKRIGGDCAGALTIFPERKSPIQRDDYKPISQEQLARWSRGG